ncbi:hypothetical protein [Rhizobium oryzicola]|uniref:DUF2726 domain-containing protein n=1 Tax=Rhizobium oryzicola TaxID=1232668 RepID=A0ABT8SY48_9HYPH|nr:hypothetical protein [Rhizobium oryzicola]MDO1583205.1 hypothetical protein [Rhizobium oryzicola]
MKGGAHDADDDFEHADAGFMQLPIGDLFLALGAAFLVAMLLSIGLRVNNHVWRDEQNAELQVLARREGLLLPAERSEPKLVVKRDAIPGNAALLTRLRSGKAAHRSVLLVIDSGGGESAFLFENLIAGVGLSKVRRLRLDEDCAFTQTPLDPGPCRALLARLRQDE